jgi:hypothetical protein
MRSRSSSRVVWLVVVAVIVAALVFSSSAVMDWLRVTIHGR